MTAATGRDPEPVAPRTAAVALALVVLVVLAGCSGLAGEDRSRPTPTPAPVPTGAGVDNASAIGSQRSLAPGVGPAGRTDPLALSLAHDRVVTNRSVTVSFERVRRYPNGSLHSRRARTVQVSADRQRLFSDFENSGPGATYFPEGGSVTVFTDGERLLQRTRRGGRTSYGGLSSARYREGTTPIVPYLPGGGRIYVVFASVDTRLVGSERGNGTERYRLESVGTVQTAGLAGSEGIDAVRELSVAATVDQRGVVQSYRLRYTGLADGTPLSVRVTASYRAVGTTEVERPPWYDRALRAVEGDPDGDGDGDGNATVAGTGTRTDTETETKAGADRATP